MSGIRVQRSLSVVLCGLLLTAALGASGEQERRAAQYGVIEFAQGEVTVNGEAAAVGREVQSGDRIETGPDGRVEIVFDNRNIFALQEETVLTLSFADGEVREVGLQQGAFAAVFDRLREVTSDGDGFRIRTPTAVGGVRGTTFYVQVEEPWSSYICTCEGRTALTPLAREEAPEAAEPRLVESTHHTAYRFVQTADGVDLQEAAMIYHDDAVMDALAAKIGVSIPWGE